MTFACKGMHGCRLKLSGRFYRRGKDFFLPVSAKAVDPRGKSGYA